ncbi:MAG: SprT family zinc-dependent metalloprotease [Actinomycetaceae bacterium]|nr:SprT family zinc-dependent metalloprotease [Actinomycetaceae bacterium]
MRVLKKRGLKNMYLRVKPPHGEVVLTAPSHLPNARLEAFVRSEMESIRRNRERIQAREQKASRDFVTGETFRLWGIEYQLKVVPSGRPRVQLKGGEIVMQAPASYGKEQRGRLLDKLYRRELKAALPKAIERCETRTGQRAYEYRIKKMKTRWGSCNVREKRIWLSLQLAQKPPECLDYVLTHELVHLIETNHTPRFHRLVAQFYPGWQEAKQALKSN